MSKSNAIQHTQSSFASRFLKGLFFWPIILLWKCVTWVCKSIGIMLCLVLGVALMGAGYILTSTIIGAILGIPLMIIGFFLLLRALY
ncbi:MAG: hypothetical protein COA73_17295 [Candidatus Hydrogenedentota bacterium]|nr:MAG: hypothetical protein COA73_17295 [Candidatus Hydrogenedentota bacterium]